MELNIDSEADPHELIVVLSDIDQGEFFNVIDQGFSSEIVYTVRMRNRTVYGALMNHGGRIIWKVTRKASKEYLTGMYLIDTDGKKTAYKNINDFASDFFSCRTPVPSEYFDSSGYLIEARAAADLIKRPVPMSLLDPFLTSEIIETSWVSLDN